MSDNNDFSFKIDPEKFKINLPEEDMSSSVKLDDFTEYGTTNVIVPMDIRENEDDLKGADLYRKDEEEKSLIREHKKRDKIKSHKNKLVFNIVWLAMVVLVALSLASYLITGSNDFFAVDRTEGEATVVIPRDVTLDELATILEEANVINTAEFFKIYCGMTTSIDTFDAGSYVVDTTMDYEGIISYLQAGTSNQEVVTLMFPEGYSLTQIAEKLEENGVTTVEMFMEAANSDEFDNYDIIEFIDNAEDKYYKLEGYVFPNTYDFYINEDISSVIGKFLTSFQKNIDEDLYNDILESGYTLDEIVTLASIIQEEAANTEDMYVISAILRNRLESGESVGIYTLGCECTLYYPYTASTVPDDFTSDYSTYTYSGLPAGAICNPGLEAIKAAVYPDEDYDDYYYFCHDSEGNPYYAKTLEQHMENFSNLQ